MRLVAATLASLALTTVASAETVAPAAASAAGNPVTVTGSITFASRYVSDGIEYSTGAVLQPYVELGFGGFYAGIWASNAAEELLGADSEIDFYLGYRGEAGAFYYDIGYAYYTFPGASEFNTGEVVASAGVGLNETVYLTAGLAYSSEFETLDRNLRVDYYTPVEGLSLAATYGYNDAWHYWTVGADYAVNETLSVNATWNDTNIEDLDGVLVLSLTTSFSLR